MKKVLYLLPLLMLGACSSPQNVTPVKEEDHYYVLYMYNYPRVTIDTVSGNPANVENLLYLRQEITLNELIEKPVDPQREKYEFAGWFQEEQCETPWNFEVDKPTSSILLYAKWGISQSEDFVEPEYIYSEKIIEDEAFRLTGVLSSPISDNKVNLTKGAINRLIENEADVKFALNYERRSDVEITSAFYDVGNESVEVEISTGQSYSIDVTDITPRLSIASENSTFETKTQNYEAKGAAFENYHIMLAGSSSMENWDTSTEDLAPIVSYNHGIGGTTVRQWTEKLFERLVMPYAPKAVVYYVGVNNIINTGDTGETTGKQLLDLFNKTHEYLPHTQIFYVLINKLPGFRSYQSEFDVANNYALDFAKENAWVRCIDAGQGLLKENGEPHHSYFCTDGLHMSRYGYVIWGQAVKDALIDWMK